MSSNARSSIDLGLSKLHNSPPTTNFTSSCFSPPRLQRSPSLPNIWFPPHSGPIPQKMSSNHSTKPESRARHIKYASIDPTHRKPTLPKTHARRRTEKDLRNSLLTPPLTPSSSIRTTASHDSSLASAAGLSPDDEPNDEKMADTKFEEEIKDVDTESTRYILLGNVNRSLDVTDLTVAVVKSVLIAQGRNPTVLELNNIHQIIVAANSRLLENQGVVPIVFYDVRDAKAAKIAISAKQDGPLESFVADKVDENGERAWLSCQFISLEELRKILGNSEYLANTDASFWVAAQKADHTTPENDATEQAESPTQPGDLSATRGGINVPMLQNIFKSYGNVRSFTFDRLEVLEDKTTAAIYHIEYYNLPEATNALERLQNQAMFGMKINAFRPRSLISQKQHDELSTNVPFPNPSTAGESFNGLASSASEDPFPRPPEDESSTVELNEAVAALSLQPVPGQRVIPSPPFFYHSSPGDAHTNLGTNVGGPADQQETSSPSTVSQPSGEYLDPQLLQSQSTTEQPWGSDVAYRTQATSPFCSADCTYCPSFRSSNRSGYNANYAPYSITPPFSANYYYPPVPPTPLPQPIHPHMLFQNPGPPTVYEAPEPNVVGFGPWVYDPAIAYAIPNGRNVVQMGNNICPTPNPFYREDQPNGQYQPSYTTDPQAPQTRPENGSTPGFVMNGAPLATIPAPQAPAQQDPLTPSTQTALAPDRNQLNLAAIRDGRDTRTTVMIKNIPNKMSDTDLMTYIAKVCPRKIDFLYLRMDFQNGCNVGYAFVNFIYVQDLLHFAEKRLGERWNMFSSEKVLQMSYATYQGKEALIEKFKNSCIMDERESWRPKIFYSYGPEQGMSEPFPPSTHRGRKERSSHNRGALFVPSAGGLMHSHRLHNSQGRRQHDTTRSQQGRPRYLDQQSSSYYPSR